MESEWKLAHHQSRHCSERLFISDYIRAVRVFENEHICELKEQRVKEEMVELHVSLILCWEIKRKTCRSCKITSMSQIARHELITSWSLHQTPLSTDLFKARSNTRERHFHWSGCDWPVALIERKERQLVPPSLTAWPILSLRWSAFSHHSSMWMFTRIPCVDEDVKEQEQRWHVNILCLLTNCPGSWTRR